MPILPILYVAIPAYLLGSIPFGLVLTKCAGLGDIREIGSGNIGATNVLRTGRRWLALVTLLLDGGKGSVAVLLAGVFFPGMETIAGLAVLLGHLFPIWLKGKGGKGVATSIGVIAALCWQAGLAVMITWLLVAYLSRYSSLAAIISIGLSPFYAFLLKRPGMLWLTIVIVFLVITKHGANIGRLLKGKESRIGAKKE